jgi:hypothetical protein
VDLTEATTSGEALDRVRIALGAELTRAQGRSLAVRLRLEGACPVHADLAGASDHWVEEFRSLAHSFGEGALWIEKVLFRTQPAADLQAAFDREDALGGLLRTLRDLETGDDELTALAADFAELRTKLPAELFADSETLDPADPERLRSLLGDVKDLLLARLLAGSEAVEAAAP